MSMTAYGGNEHEILALYGEYIKDAHGFTPQYLLLYFNASSIDGCNYKKNIIRNRKNKWITIKVSQKKTGHGVYLLQYSLDNVVVCSFINNGTDNFENVKLYALKPKYSRTIVAVRNVILCSTGKCIIV